MSRPLTFNICLSKSNVFIKHKLHYFDLSWICCTTSYTTVRQVVQQIYNILTCRRTCDQHSKRRYTTSCAFVLLQEIHSRTNPQQSELMELRLNQSLVCYCFPCEVGQATCCMGEPLWKRLDPKHTTK